MNSLFIFLLLTITIPLMAQSPWDSLILTKEQNTSWLLNLEKQSKPKQLELIRQRLLLDTNIYINLVAPDGLTIDNDRLRGNRIVGYGRPLLVFNQIYFKRIDNETKGVSIIKLCDLLTDKEIQTVSIVKEPLSTALYGSESRCGVVLLTTRTKTTLQRIKDLDLH